MLKKATIMVYKSLYGLAPEFLSSNFERQDTAYNLRESENKLNVSMQRTHSSFSGTVFLVAGAKQSP